MKGHTLTKTTTKKPNGHKAKTPDFWDHIEAAVATTKPKRRSAVDEKLRSLRGSKVFWARFKAAIYEIRPDLRRAILQQTIVQSFEELPSWEPEPADQKEAAKSSSKEPAKASVKPAGGKAPSPAPKAKTPAAKAAAARSRAFHVEIMDSDRV